MTSGETFELNGQVWSDFNKRALKISPESFGSIKALILKLCKKQNECNIAQVENQLLMIEATLDQ